MITGSTCCFQRRKFLSESFSVMECVKEFIIAGREEGVGSSVGDGGGGAPVGGISGLGGISGVVRTGGGITVCTDGGGAALAMSPAVTALDTIKESERERKRERERERKVVFCY